MWPSSVVGGTVLGVRASRPGEPGEPRVPDLESDSAVVAVDAATGKKKWDLADRYPASNLYLTFGDVAVIFTSESSDSVVKPHAVIVDAATGDELADLGEVARCVDDGANLIACRRSANDDMVIFDVDARKVIATVTGPFSGGWHGYFFMDDRVVDREGNPVIGDLPGDRVEAMSDDYAVVANDDEKKLTVHRVEK
jgi:hypothetical protein